MILQKALPTTSFTLVGELRVIRVLTHGGKLTVPITETVSHLQEIVQMAPTGLTILPGGGVTFENAGWLAQQLHVSELHGSKNCPITG